MKVFVCKICQEVYIGKTIPPSCPFCGVENKYFALSHVFEDTNNLELSDISQQNLIDALKLEISNANFYDHAHKILENTSLKMMFKGLSKVEKEHASVFRKILQDVHLEYEDETFPSEEHEILEESRKREIRASEFYARASQEALEDRVKEVFSAIMNAEKDHIELDEEMLEKF